jgi:preprotein translocase subunit SecE
MVSLSKFFKETLLELKKVRWPARSEFLISVFATLVVVLIFSLFFAAVDGIIGNIIRKIISFFV